MTRRSLLPMLRAVTAAAKRSGLAFVLLWLACAPLEWAEATQPPPAAASLGFIQLPQPGGGFVTVFYPSSAPEAPMAQGPFALSLAAHGPVARGNGHLVVISPGSGGSPWVHADLARALVAHGFTVALPQHAGDNYLDPSRPGPESWIRRPGEVSAAIDSVAADPSLSANVTLSAVGLFGGSAGGHTALSMAGGEWSERRFRDHCEQHIREDFNSCVGFLTRLKGNWLDPLKIWLAKVVIKVRFSDATAHGGFDPRIRATVAMVPFAADFDLETLRSPRTTLGLVIADQDINQVPRFHVLPVLGACEPRCEVVMRLPRGSHGAMLSPVPPLEHGSVGEHLLGDPPDFDRARTIPELNLRIVNFFERTLIEEQQRYLGRSAEPTISTRF